LPEGWAIAALPTAAKLGNGVGSVEVSSSHEGRSTHIIRRITLAEQVVAAPDAAKVRELLVAWLSPAGRELLLRPPAKAAAKKP
jgi:hypothetical protein